MMQKKLLFISFLIVLLPILALANNTESQNKSEDVYIPLKAIKDNTAKGGIKHAPAIQVVTAYINGDLLTVNFTSSAPNATIAISDALTGEVEYTEVCNAQSTTIDLTMLALTGSG